MARGAQAGDGSSLDMREATWLINPGSVGQPRDGDPAPRGSSSTRRSARAAITA